MTEASAPLQAVPPDAGTRSAPETPAASSPAVLDRVTRRFGDVLAVDQISLTVPDGAIVGIIGPSGSGKTTTIRMLTGQLRPTDGRVRVLGRDPTNFERDIRERIGYMPQLFVLYQELTARENVDFVASLFGMLWRRRRRRVREVLEVVDLWEARNRRASQLSGGMQRRLELACALVHEPWLLFLDEPTAGIDPILRQQIWAELRRVQETGRTLLVTTQYVSEAEYCDLVALIAEGRLVALAPPEELRRQALGGEVIEIETAGPIDGAALPAIPGVLRMRQRTPRDLLVVAEDAGAATPLVLDAIREVGGEVTSSREFRPPFEEVFAELVTRHTESGRVDADSAPAAAR